MNAMQIVELKYKTFAFPLSKNVKTAGQNISEKKVILLKARNSKGKTIFAEVSPLKNFSNETIAECETFLNKIFDNKKFPIEIKELEEYSKKIKNVPSLKFAIEQLILSFNLLEKKNYYTDLIKQSGIKLNTMVGIKPFDETMYEISEMLRKGFDVIKLKIGRNNFEEDLVLIKKIKEKYKDKIKLRLDVNRKWSCNEAIERLEELSEYEIEYIEEPVETKDELLNLAAVSKHHLVPDESIESYDDAVEFIETGYFNFIVLKPSIRTEIFDTIKIIKLAEERNVNVIITSAFETAIGRSALLYLASLTNHNFAHGLGVELLGKDIVPGQFDFNNPEVKINMKKLLPELDLDI